MSWWHLYLHELIQKEEKEKKNVNKSSSTTGCFPLRLQISVFFHHYRYKASWLDLEVLYETLRRRQLLAFTASEELLLKDQEKKRAEKKICMRG